MSIGPLKKGENSVLDFGHCISHYKRIWLAARDVPLYVSQGLHPNIVLVTIKKKNIGGTTKKSRNITFEHVKTLLPLQAELSWEGLLDVHIGVHDEGVVKLFCSPNIL